ncbi:hypothetical protein, partial [Ligilactobacillus ruminis]|uniref:hypothetical protein n=1 Tax=Ligilactobacillus ruminis TaxID=1623 RepID=UPI003D06F644
VDFWQVLSGIFLVLMHETLFAKCSTSHRLLNQCAKTEVRAKWRFLRFARKIQSPVTGKMAISGICP